MIVFFFSQCSVLFTLFKVWWNFKTGITSYLDATDAHLFILELQHSSILIKFIKRCEENIALIQTMLSYDLFMFIFWKNQLV